VRTSAAAKIKLLLLVAVALLASFALPGSASAFASPIKLGVYVASQGQVGAPEDAAVLDSYAQMVGRKPDIVMDYSNITEPLLTGREISNLTSRGEVPLVTWQLFQSGWSGPTIPLSSIASGSYDSYIRKAAELAKTIPSEVMLRFAHEMNGNWYGWSGNPSAYVAAFRHVVEVFRGVGASNVKFVWAPNVDYGSYPFAAYFPDDSYVDYVALDGYNWGTSGQGTNRWESLREVFASSYQKLTQLSSKPVMISETASGESGGSKASWIREGFLQTIPQDFPRVQAVVWFDRSQELDWRIDSSASSLAAYREVVASTLYGGTVAPPASAPAPEPKVELVNVTPTAPSSAPTESTAAGKQKSKGHKSSGSIRGRVAYRLSTSAPVRLAGGAAPVSFLGVPTLRNDDDGGFLYDLRLARLGASAPEISARGRRKPVNSQGEAMATAGQFQEPSQQDKDAFLAEEVGEGLSREDLIEAMEELLVFVRESTYQWENSYYALVYATMARSARTYEGICLLLRACLPVQAAMLARCLFEDVIVAHWLAFNKDDQDWLVQRFLRHREAIALHQEKLEKETKFSTGTRLPVAPGLKDREAALVDEFGKQASGDWWDPGREGHGEGKDVGLRKIVTKLEKLAAEEVMFFPRFAGGEEPLLDRLDRVIHKGSASAFTTPSSACLSRPPARTTLNNPATRRCSSASAPMALRATGLLDVRTQQHSVRSHRHGLVPLPSEIHRDHRWA